MFPLVPGIETQACFLFFIFFISPSNTIKANYTIFGICCFLASHGNPWLGLMVPSIHLKVQKGSEPEVFHSSCSRLTSLATCKQELQNLNRQEHQWKRDSPANCLPFLWNNKRIASDPMALWQPHFKGQVSMRMDFWNRCSGKLSKVAMWIWYPCFGLITRFYAQKGNPETMDRNVGMTLLEFPPTIQW